MLTPVVSVVGYSNSGKTRVATSLVASLSEHGYRVTAIKHCHDGHDVDRPGSDTSQLYEAGAATVVASSPGQMTKTERVDGDYSLESIAARVGGGADIIIAEGFKASSVPKVLVIGNDAPPDVEGVIAVVSDSLGEWSVPTYAFDDLNLLSEQIRKEFLEADAPDLLVTLIVDGESVPLKRYPASALASVVKGFVSSLHDVPQEPQDIQITVKITAKFGVTKDE